jgi:hypothetical protein
LKIKKQISTRIYHTWDKWECYPAGFYENQKEGLTDDECREAYRVFLSDLETFRKGLIRVTSEWKNSCEHYLTNEAMNRIAWLGQASACLVLGLPSKCRSGYFLLTETQQREADNLALEYLNQWLIAHDMQSVDLEGAGVKTKVNLY